MQRDHRTEAGVPGLLLLLAVTASSCAPASPVVGVPLVPVSSLPDSALASDGTEYRLHEGDRLAVQFYFNPELDQEVVVRPDGRISLPLVGEVPAEGWAPGELSAELARLYDPFLRTPEVVVIVREFTPRRVFVTGEVNRPGLIEAPRRLSALQAIAEAGGMKNTAEFSSVVIMRDQGTAEPLYLALDLSAGGDSTRVRDVPLRTNDIVIVPRTRISQVNQVVDEYGRRLIPITLSMGLSYVLGGSVIP